MNKTNPIGVRFDEEKLEFVKTQQNLSSPQQAVNFLFDRYWNEFNPISSPFTELKEKFDAVVKERDAWVDACAQVTSEFQKQTLIWQRGGSKPDYSNNLTEIKDNGIDIADKRIEIENKPITAPKKERAVDKLPPTKRNAPNGLETHNAALAEDIGEPEVDISEIERQIAVIRAEKIPKERDTALGRLPWKLERQKRIEELKKLLK